MGKKQRGEGRGDSGISAEKLFQRLFMQESKRKEEKKGGFIDSGFGADEAFRSFMEHGKSGREILDYIKMVPGEDRDRIVQKIKMICEASKVGILPPEDLKALKGWIKSIQTIVKGLNLVIVELVTELSDLDCAPEMLKSIKENRDNFMKTLNIFSQCVLLSEEVSDDAAGRSGSESDTGLLEVGEEVEEPAGDS